MGLDGRGSGEGLGGVEEGETQEEKSPLSIRGGGGVVEIPHPDCRDPAPELRELGSYRAGAKSKQLNKVTP